MENKLAQAIADDKMRQAAREAIQQRYGSGKSAWARAQFLRDVSELAAKLAKLEGSK